MNLFIVLISKIYKFKTVVTIHDIDPFKGKGFLDFASLIVKLSDSIIVHNNFSKNELYKKIKFETKKINVIPHGNYINAINYFKYSQKKLNNLLFFGQIKKVKGLDVVFKGH